MATTTRKPKATNAEKLAAIITADFGGRAKLADLAAATKVKKAFPGNSLLYRRLHGIVTNDKGAMFNRPAPGEVAVKKAGRSK